MSSGTTSPIGQVVELEVGPVAHGGHCVSRLDGHVVFVRHAIPGERVRAVVTEGDDGDRYLRADAVEILAASPDRVAAPCPYAGPGRCGGCDYQHVAPAAQRSMLAAVVREQLLRLAGLDRPVVVEPVPGDEEGLGWRTRVRFVVDDGGACGLRRHRSHDVERVDRCLIGHPGLPPVTDHRWPGVTSVEAVVSGTGEQLVVVEPGVRDAGRLPAMPGVSVLGSDGARVRGRTYVEERAAGRTWRVAGNGFWQVHPGAAETLTRAVLGAVRPRPGERVLDLYGGVGLFAGALADAVGTTGQVTTVESDRRASADARRNLHSVPNLQIVQGRVERVLTGEPVDVVVLDPPRTGARRRVVEAIADMSPRAIGYVACDPAALARDVATFVTRGYVLSSLRAFAMFPMTHHVECVALLEPG
jgi:tRNA/tmRNA/rRNA uracil-C5-methylase (TrmA/RlmC/RlmD family)